MPRDSFLPAGLVLVLPVILSLSACVDGGPGRPSVSPAAYTPTVKRYHCENGSDVVIENRGTSVVVTDETGQPVELPASPTGSRARYGSGAYALVLEDGEALWMKAGEEPGTCLR
ncbi:hypothetical protein [Aquibium oceanicum]|uniref:C-type lysozyme inhibitor domain-containing protein n=1 Tax=Aquibium oceanicum TaxID=1670800 RepID=A0A1L3SL00_9HYPH|nr:hypothetical protein [Aquibium oceanicum]APH70060.1 hypothetical protein BSQ44_00690 [Aquibium oceanicum]